MSRRDFLKLLSLLPLVKWLRPIGETDISSQRQKASKPNVLILLFDAFAAQHASVYGYRRDTTPNLARFAEHATVYHAHYAAGNFTTPGTASLFTGTYPWSHRAFNPYGTVARSHAGKTFFSALDKDYTKVAYTHNSLVVVLLNQFCEDLDVFKPAWDICLGDVIFSGQAFPNDPNVAYWSERLILSKDNQTLPSSLFVSLLDEKYRLDKLEKITQEYQSLFPRGIPTAGIGTRFFILEHAIDWIEAQLGSVPQPFLMYFHLFPPHGPYHPRREFIGRFNDSWTPVTKKPHPLSAKHSNQVLNSRRRKYDEYIAYLDAEFGRLYDFMAQSGVLGNTYVVFTSDHGQMFERGIHGHLTPVLYNPVIRIPLLVSKPGQQRRRDVYRPTSCVDLLPTLLHATGQVIPDWCEGELLPAFGEKTNNRRSIFSVEAKGNPKRAPLTKATVALIKNQYKLIHYFGYRGYGNKYELYDLRNDLEEMEDLYSSRRSIAADLRNELAEKLHEVNQPYLGR